MRPIIEFCASNLADGAQKAYETLEKDLNLDVVDYGCLSLCGKCARSPFALVNGELVIGEDSNDLVKKVYKFLDDNPVF
ncbi:MAG: YuzB family protein [Bacillaceae bacterium]|nr:YuzB family protein [Bacillaceae bacterium]